MRLLVLGVFMMICGFANAIQECADKRDLFGGDMHLSPRQRAIVDKVMRGGEELDKEDLRKATSDLASRWKEATVPYAIDPSSDQDKAVIEEAIEHWRKKTCLKFVPYDNNIHTDYILFVGKCDGCWSSLGRIGGRQMLSIGTGCDTVGTVIHEIGHAIGFQHEHQRPNRDYFISIHLENAQEEYRYAFDELLWEDTTDGNIGYDVGSIMHYNPCAFSINSEFTITTVDPTDMHFLGQDEGLSPKDAQLAKFIYACPDINDCEPNPCQNGGECFDEINTFTCMCLYGFVGETCSMKSDFCKDNPDENCESRKAQGECKCNSPNMWWMWKDCPKSCNIC